jgi:hypothetical protein
LSQATSGTLTRTARRKASQSFAMVAPPMPSLLPCVCGHKKTKTRRPAVAIFHLSFKVLTEQQKQEKAKARFILAAYNSREKKDELTGLTFDYTKKTIYIKAALFCQKMPLPDFMTGRHYGEIARNQNRKDSQICRYAIIALPRELNGEQNEELLKKYLKNNFVKLGNVRIMLFTI